MKSPVRIVLDTNVLVSGLIKRDSPPGKIMDQLVTGVLRAILEPCLMDEYERVLARPRLHIPPDEAHQVLAFLAVAGEWVSTDRLDPQPDDIPDPGDLPFAEAAAAGKVEALVTGNPRHFTYLKGFNVRVLTPAEFLQWLSQHQAK